ncbi:MAG: alpha/beta hydrolase [Peptostreptococcaceae bacterium]|nr:alpha/beta hydrolase [Peptostreptococcaceae bacterium]
MKKELLTIQGIPAILWGDPSTKIIVAVHGYQGSKGDKLIQILVSSALKKGYQVMSFDLPAHGDRKEEGELRIPDCIRDLRQVMDHVQQHWQEVSLFANSLGAYLSLLGYGEERLHHAWFLAPLVDMVRFLDDLLRAFQITPKQLEQAKKIIAPDGQVLDWNFYQDAKSLPLSTWETPTHILYGKKDEVCAADTIQRFVERSKAHLTTLPQAEHYFYTDEDRAIFSQWLDQAIPIAE